MIYKHFLLALAPVIAVTNTASSTNNHLRGVIISLASDANEPTRGSGSLTNENEDSFTIKDGNNRQEKAAGALGFDNSCLRGRFSYWNAMSDVASISVGVFDGNGKITEMDNIEINHPDPNNGGRTETSLPFNSGSYEVHANGRGVMYLSMGAPGGPFYDPPAMAEFVVTRTSGSGCEITAMFGFLSSKAEDGHENDVGVSNQLVAPTWNKIADY
ncbi:hypothetical protein ACHAXM_009920 [Skeletonema potamos]|jgi:hypothetical protein